MTIELLAENSILKQNQQILIDLLIQSDDVFICEEGREWHEAYCTKNCNYDSPTADCYMAFCEYRRRTDETD